ncbi:MAG: phage tail assembly chaperone [Oscillospiraceae bacterium]
MGKLEDFLLAQKIEAQVETEVVVSTRFVDKGGAPLPFRIRSITEAENKAIRKECQKTTFNKKTRQKDVETDTDLFLNRLVLACTVEPNFKNAELQKHYGVMGAEALINAMLLPGEYTELLQAVQEINGFDLDVNSLVEEAKN